MKLAKSSIDIGLRSNKLEEMLQFWRDEVGLPFQGVQQMRPGQAQHRLDANGSVLKINHHEDPLEAHPPTGYRELIIARPGLAQARRLTDPEGTPVVLVPPGYDGVGQVGVRMGVRDLQAHRRFYAETLGLAETRPGVFAAHETLFFLEEDKNATAVSEMYGPGFRYVTFQVADGVGEHERMVAAEARTAWEPRVVNTPVVVSISMVLDLDGNWIEILQRP